MTPFEPKGDVAEWRLVYDIIRKRDPDEPVTIEELEEALSRPLGQNRSPVYRAIRELEENDSRTLSTVRGVGYRVALASEHLGLALNHSSRSRRQMRRGIQRSESADRRALDPSQAARMEAFEAHASRVVEFLSHMSRKVDQHGSRLENLEGAKEETSGRIEAVEEALKRHGLT
jgi:hypothetical protein